MVPPNNSLQVSGGSVFVELRSILITVETVRNNSVALITRLKPGENEMKANTPGIRLTLVSNDYCEDQFVELLPASVELAYDSMQLQPAYV